MRLLHFDEYDPHRILGLHDKTIRLWRPGAQKVYLEVFGKSVEAKCVHEAGLFEYKVPSNTTYKDYKVYHQNGLLAHDPYAFLPAIGELDLYLFGKGVHYQLYHAMGGRLTTNQDVQGVKFTLWAPNAKSVALVGDFNHWDGRVNPMRTLGGSGIWELFIPGLKAGEKYKFEIRTQNHELRLKSDPMALANELRPSTASIVADIDHFAWNDSHWMEKRVRERDYAKPLNIYEVHLGSWKKQEGWKFINYKELAVDLAQYCLAMGYTHVELLPIQEHPLDESWGYQVSGYYAVTSRFGTPEDFQWFVNHLHENNIGVILDWVPGHFPTDDFSLGRFDGTALYEHANEMQGFHPHWSTYIFNFGRHEVVNFLIANALFWFDKMHIDGLRVDAVASMLYLNYGREGGAWIPNKFGGIENLEAIEFIKHLNSVVHDFYPGVMMIAEESTSFPGVTTPVGYGGLGFDMKWNMGWMNDTLRYISKDPVYRQHHQNDLTFGLLYAFSEKFVLVLSHDEVANGKNSLIGKIPGDSWQQFANMRLLLSYMMCHPGKKLLFMGSEIGQWNEWSCTNQIEWFLLQFSTHRGVHEMVKTINHLYLKNSPLWERDFDYSGFEWIDYNDRHNSVISYLRKSSEGILLCVHNFTPNYHPSYFIKLRNVQTMEEIFNSDDVKFGGSDKKNFHPEIIKEHGYPVSLNIQMAPLATMIFKVTF
jgi:1,4-alpha-glucan branching enzyme